ncbi:MAG: transcription-repair coupling factor, partial [Bacteroidaceae bacterium]
MNIIELQNIYAKHPNAGALAKLLEDSSVKTIFIEGLCASSSTLFSSSFLKKSKHSFVFILADLEEAGYFYHDLTQINGEERVLFFPSSYRRAIKYGQKDAANEILRTEVLSRLQKTNEPLCIVTYPDALAEKVVSQQELSDKTLKLMVGEHVDTIFITEMLSSYGFEHVDYVYEPGQYAVRGSIIDVFSFASEYPYRIDFFGDEVESIRSFEVDSQLSKEKKQSIAIVPELTKSSESDVSFLDFIPTDTVLAMKDFLWVRERIQAVRDEALSPQALIAQEEEEFKGTDLEQKLIDGAQFTVKALDFRRIEFGHKPTGTPQAKLSFECSPQPIFHKNFDLVSASLKNYL